MQSCESILSKCSEYNNTTHNWMYSSSLINTMSKFSWSDKDRRTGCISIQWKCAFLIRKRFGYAKEEHGHFILVVDRFLRHTGDIQ